MDAVRPPGAADSTLRPAEDAVFRALADPTRRALLDRLFQRDGQALMELAAGQAMTRYGVMKHLAVLEAAGLVATRRAGRRKLHFLNPVPIRRIHDRWIGKYAERWVSALGELKTRLEGEEMEAPKHVYQVYIRTSAEKLWRAITDPELTQKYFYGGRIEMDGKPGSPYVYRMADGELALEGTVLEVDPPRRLVTTFRFARDPETKGEKPSRVTWEIEDLGGVCRLTLVHDDFEGETKTWRVVQSGWNPVLSGLKTLLETGEPLAIPQPARA